MKQKYYFFFTFLLGMIFLFLGIFAFIFPRYFFYFVVLCLGIVIVIDVIFDIIKGLVQKKINIVNILVKGIFGLLFILKPKLPLSLVVIIFALYLCLLSMIYMITYRLYKKEKVMGRITFLVGAIVLFVIGMSYIMSPSIHVQQMTWIFGLYCLYLGLKYIFKSIREMLSENRKDSLKRRIRVSLPVFFVALVPRFVIEFINQKVNVEDNNIDVSQNTSMVEVLVHVSKDGFGMMGHVDICYQGYVIAYGAYDEATHHLFGALGDGVLFIADKQKYLSFCEVDDPTSVIFGYELSLNEEQRKNIEGKIRELSCDFVEWEPSGVKDTQAKDYASRLYHMTQAQFYKFSKGIFKHYFVMTTNCVLLADRIIGRSGIDIVNCNGIITPGTYWSYFEEESRKENSRVFNKHIYVKNVL